MATTKPKSGIVNVTVADMLEPQAAAQPETAGHVPQTAIANGDLPRSERTCSRCDHSRRAGAELRCWLRPPQTIVAGADPPALAGAPPRLRTLVVQNVTWPDYSCADWAMMESDHPDILPAPTHAAPDERQ